MQHAPRFFEWLFAGLEQRRWLRRVADLLCRSAEPAVRRWCRGADVVVSTYPLASQALGRMRREKTLTAPAVTFLTDPAAHRLWCHPDVDEHPTVTAGDRGRRRRLRRDPAGRRSAVLAPLLPEHLARRPASAACPARGPGHRARSSCSAPARSGWAASPRWWTPCCAPRGVGVVLCGHNGRCADACRASAGRRTRLARRRLRLMASADVLVHNAGGCRSPSPRRRPSRGQASRARPRQRRPAGAGVAGALGPAIRPSSWSRSTTSSTSPAPSLHVRARPMPIPPRWWPP